MIESTINLLFFLKEGSTMSNYIHFSPEQKDKAYHMDIAELLRKQGEKLNRCGNEYIWESPTGKVSIRNNVWYHHYEQEGGNVVSFLQKFFKYGSNRFCHTVETEVVGVRTVYGATVAVGFAKQRSAVDKRYFLIPPFLCR